MDDPISLSAAMSAEEERRAFQRSEPTFDPRSEVSADAKYIVRSLVLWFLALPAVVGLLIVVVMNATH